MKILQIINSHALEDGGAQRLALELHRAYRARGHDAHLLSLMRSPTTEPGTYSLGFGSPYRAHVWAGLRDFLVKERWRDIDLIHVHLFPTQFWVPLSIPRSLRNAALLTTEHNTFNRRRANWVGRGLDRFTLRAYRKIICISEGTREAMARWQPESRAKLITIPNGIDLARFGTSKPLKTGAEAPIILAVGRISAQKNYATALRAVALLGDRPFRFQIAGQDEMGGVMQDLARELGLDGVEFLGFQSDIPGLLNRADIFLLCSHWEGFGLAVAEAMAAGLPVVVPDVSGVREVVGVGAESVGVLVDPKSPDSVAAGISTLLDDENLRQILGASARARAAQFDINRTIDEHLALYLQVCNASKVARP